jgi:hypothetical protein
MTTPVTGKPLACFLPVDSLATFEALFTFSPFGLCCQQCKGNVTIQMDERSIQLHLKKHGMDSRAAIVRSLLDGYNTQLDNAKVLQTIRTLSN